MHNILLSGKVCKIVEEIQYMSENLNIKSFLHLGILFNGSVVRMSIPLVCCLLQLQIIAVAKWDVGSCGLSPDTIIDPNSCLIPLG